MRNLSKLTRRSARLLIGALACSLAAMAMTQQGPKRLAPLAKPIPNVLARSIPVGKPDAGQVLHLCVTLLPPNRPALEAFAKSVSDPTSSNYGNYLTPAQFGARFGQPLSSFQKVRDYLTSQGFKVKMAGDNHLSILVDGTVAQAETAFHTTINRYFTLDPSDIGRHDFYSYSTPLSIPAEIAPLVGSVTGLQNHTKPIPRLKKFKKQNPVTNPLTPAQASVLYNTSPFHNSNYFGQERTVGISSFDGFDLNNVSLFYQQYGLKTPVGGVLNNITVEAVDGGSGSGPAGGEGDLDQQMVLSAAPQCFLIVYDGGGDLQPVLSQEAQDNSADIITESYGWQYDAADAEAAHTIHLQLTAQGITYFLASGDDGTAIDSSSPPATYGDYDTELTNVGGTVATVTSTGARTSEVSWFGSAGGWVTTPSVPFNVLPSWQKGTGVPTNLNFRLIPDVALHSAGSNDPNSDPGAYNFYYQGQLMTSYGVPGFSGTSFAAPTFAGDFALVEQQLIDKNVLKITPNLKARMGRINDLIYAQNGNSNVWYDITSGPSNGTLPNGTTANPTKGWDFVTGWGSLDFQAFSNSIAAAASIINVPSSITTYKIFGSNPTGATALNLASEDGKVYTLHSVPTSIGAISSPQYTYQLKTPVPGLNALTFTLVQSAPSNVISYVYFYNYSQGLWNLENTTQMTGSNVKITVNPYFNTQFISPTGLVTIVVRTVYPTSAGGNAFNLKTDQATLSESPASP